MWALKASDSLTLASSQREQQWKSSQLLTEEKLRDVGMEPRVLDLWFLPPLQHSTWNPEVTLSCHLWGHISCCPGLTPLTGGTKKILGKEEEMVKGVEREKRL